MNNNYSAPLQSWETNPLAEIKSFAGSETKCDKKRDISLQELDFISKCSKDYFNLHLNAAEYRMRFPNEKVANFDDCIDTKFLEIRTAVSQSPNSNRQQTPQVVLRHIAAVMKNKRYEDLRTIIERLHKENYQCFACIYCFLGSLIYNSYDFETYALRLFERAQVPEADLPHFYHLIDELASLPETSHILLTSFITHETHQIISAFNREPHVMPILSSSVPQFGRQDPMREIKQSHDPLSRIENYVHLSDLSKIKIPMMRPAADVPKTLRHHPLPKDTSCVAVHILSNQYTEAIKMATSYISQDTKLAEMYMYRAAAFYKLKRIPAAIIDITRSIEIEPTDEKLLLRAACYMSLGDHDMANKNIFDNKCNEDVKNLISTRRPINK